MRILLRKIQYSLLLLIIALLSVNQVFAQEVMAIYKNRRASIEDRIDDLLPRMTLHEKVMQMNQWTYGKNANPNNIEDKMREVKPEIGSLLYRSVNPNYRNDIQRKAMEQSRLGIPIVFAFDVIHGYRTIFPIPLAQACSWNTHLVQQSCAVAAKESKLSGVDWTFSPMVDVARDPRWGRVSEGYGEDPYANARYAVAAVQGYQGDDLSDKYTIAACLKHFVGYSLSEGGRDYRFSDVSAQTLWETLLPPFEAGVRAGAATLMSGFNDISGIPASANHYTLSEILKNKWKHDGFVISDWGSIKNLQYQGVAATRKEAGLKALKAGIEMDMVDNIYMEHLEELVLEGKISEEEINEAVRRILRLKFRLGLFDDPYVEVVNEEDRYLQKDAIQLAKDLASESVVLLKNEFVSGQDARVLPIQSTVQRIAMIGPMVKDSVHIMGFWEGKGRSSDVETLYDAMQSEFAESQALYYARGCDFDGIDTTMFQEARDMASQSDMVVLFLGEKCNWSGENGSRASLALPAIQEQLVAEMKKIGKPIVLVLSSGRPLELIRLNKMVDAMVQMWQPGTYGASSLAGILSGRINPSGKLAITFPQSTGQLPLFYNRRPSAVPNMGYYQDIPQEALFDFGYGLSYTDFDYGDVEISSSQISKNEKLYAKVKVSNVGEMRGKESVLWFISDPVADISRPMKELKFFEKKEINIGQTVVFCFEINPMRDLSYSDSKGQRHLESGEYYIHVGDQKVKFDLVD